MPIQLRAALVVTSLLALYFIVSRVKNSKMRIDDAIFWIVSSGFFVIVSLSPGPMGELASLLGFESGANLVFLLVVGVIFLKLFVLSVNLSAVTEKNSQLTQYVSLLEKKIRESKHAKQSIDS